jgi:DNA-binding NtrC family response regulator
VVVVIEERPELGRVLGEVLGTEGFEVVQVRSATDALEALNQQAVEFLVSDLTMPGHDGADALVSVTGAFPELPVIVIRDERDDDIPFFGPWRRDGSRLLLRRPFRLDDLVAASREIFGERSPA